jgi:hypothetical protein
MDQLGLKGHVEVDAELVAPPNIGQRDQQSNSATAAVGSSLATPPQPKKKKHRLTSSTDRLFSELRDLNFAVVGARLSRTARRLEEGYDTRHKLGSVKEMRDFVGKLGGLQSEHQGLRLRESVCERCVKCRTSSADPTCVSRHGFERALDAHHSVGRVQQDARDSAE